MKARIIRRNNGSYIGEVYGTFYNLFTNRERTCWEKVTPECMTEWGARRELEKWKEKNCPNTFEL